MRTVSILCVTPVNELRLTRDRHMDTLSGVQVLEILKVSTDKD
jgi:hypothetical protein